MRNAPQANVGRAILTVPRAALARIARIAASGAATRGGRLEDVGRAVHAVAGAALQYVAIPGGRPAGRGRGLVAGRADPALAAVGQLAVAARGVTAGGPVRRILRDQRVRAEPGGGTFRSADRAGNRCIV